MAADRPQFWIVAGPNGSGKSSFYRTSLFTEAGRSIWIINPDLLTVQLQQAEGLELNAANLAALDRIMAWLHASIETYQTIGVETVLSSPKYRAVVEAVKARGFAFNFVYFILRDADLQIDRIRTRVAKGGHAVPDDKVRARRARSLEQLPWFFAAADRASIYDNSSDEPRLIGRKQGSLRWIADDAPPDLREALHPRP